MEKFYFRILVFFVMFVIVTGCIDLLGTTNNIEAQELLTDEQLFDMNKLYGMPNTFIKQQIQKCWIQNGKASALSGIVYSDEQLYVKYKLTTEKNGTVVMSNCLTLTDEEITEQSSSQTYRQNLPERELARDTAWNTYESEYASGSFIINRRYTDDQGKIETTTEKEQKDYNLRKSTNIKEFNWQLSEVRAVINRAEKDLRQETAKLARLKEEGSKDALSEKQVVALQHYLTKYKDQLAQLTKQLETEQSRVYEMPEQEYEQRTYAQGRKVNKGKGLPLANPDDIKKLVDLKQLTADYSVMKSDVAIVPIDLKLNPFFEQPNIEEWAAWRKMTTNDLTEIDAEQKNPEQKIKHILTREEAMAEWNRRTGNNQTEIDSEIKEQ